MTLHAKICFLFVYFDFRQRHNSVQLRRRSVSSNSTAIVLPKYVETPMTTERYCDRILLITIQKRTRTDTLVFKTKGLPTTDVLFVVISVHNIFLYRRIVNVHELKKIRRYVFTSSSVVDGIKRFIVIFFFPIITIIIIFTNINAHVFEWHDNGHFNTYSTKYNELLFFTHERKIPTSVTMIDLIRIVYIFIYVCVCT